jgi:hypothetical protein
MAVHQIMGHEVLVQESYVYLDRKDSIPFTILFYSTLLYSILCKSIPFQKRAIKSLNLINPLQGTQLV